MPQTRADAALAAVKTAVDVVATNQGATTERGAGRAYEIGRQRLEESEYWFDRAAKLDGFFTDPNYWDESEPITDDRVREAVEAIETLIDPEEYRVAHYGTETP